MGVLHVMSPFASRRPGDLRTSAAPRVVLRALLGMWAICANVVASAQPAVPASAASAAAPAPAASSSANPATEEMRRAQKMAEQPFRWIILSSNIQRGRTTPTAPNAPSPTTPTTTAPAPAPSAAPVAPPSPPRATSPSVARNVPARRPDPAPATVSPLSPSASKPTPSDTSSSSVPTASNASASGSVSVASMASEEDSGPPPRRVMLQVLDPATAERLPDGSYEDTSGSFVPAQPHHYSAQLPDPVLASLRLDGTRRLFRVDYNVPAAVGQSGGAGSRALLNGSGIALWPPANNGNLEDALLEVEVDASAPMRLKVFIVGPQARSDGAYPYFVLPVTPGLRTYGLYLADFVQPAWSSTAPDIREALQNVQGVGVEYSRGDALGKEDRGTFWFGAIRFSQPR